MDINESIGRRSWNGTKHWLLDHIVAWFLAFFVPGGGALIAALVAPPAISVWGAALLGFAGGIAGLVLLFVAVYVIQFWLAPYKQRNEARERVYMLEDSRKPCLDIIGKPVKQWGPTFTSLEWLLEIRNKGVELGVLR